MGLIKQIHNYFWHRYYDRELAKLNRKKEIINIEQAGNIGILLNVVNVKTYEKASDFVKYLQDKGKNVKVLGFINNKTIPYYCHPKLAYDYFTTKDLNWYKRPSNHFVNDFMRLNFDLCINLDLHYLKPLQYVSGLSMARLKVGPWSEDSEKFFDLMIKIDDKDDLSEYVKQVDYYLSKLKPSANEKI